MILNNNCTVNENNLLMNEPPATGEPDLLFETDHDEGYDERERYLNGEYKIILQVVSVLTYGKLAKRLTDQAINMCDHMQNLRRAIYDYRLRMESMTDRHSKKYATTREVGLNYLVRYFYLIVFADYLLEEVASPTCTLETPPLMEDIVTVEDAQKLTTFKTWLNGRREITNILKLQSFDLS